MLATLICFPLKRWITTRRRLKVLSPWNWMAWNMDRWPTHRPNHFSLAISRCAGCYAFEATGTRTTFPPGCCGKDDGGCGAWRSSSSSTTYSSHCHDVMTVMILSEGFIVSFEWCPGTFRHLAWSRMWCTLACNFLSPSIAQRQIL